MKLIFVKSRRANNHSFNWLQKISIFLGVEICLQSWLNLLKERSCLFLMLLSKTFLLWNIFLNFCLHLRSFSRDQIDMSNSFFHDNSQNLPDVAFTCRLIQSFYVYMIKPAFNNRDRFYTASDLKGLMDSHADPLVFSDVDPRNSDGIYISVVVEFLFFK